MEIYALTKDGIEILKENSTYIGIFSTLLIALINIAFNFRILRIEKRLSARVILDYEIVKSCGLKLESLKDKGYPKIMDTSNYSELSKIFNDSFKEANNCFVRYKIFEKYIENGQFLRLLNNGPQIIYDVKISINIKVSVDALKDEFVESINSSIPVLKIDDDVFILTTIQPNIKYTMKMPVCYEQNISSIEISYLTQHREQIEYLIEIKNGNAYTKVFSSKPKGLFKAFLKEQIMEYKTDSLTEWVYIGKRLKNEEVYRNFSI
ncbi:hypothetical protein [Fusibacter sp. 3D3]|uniref:hypothetical protein n=1 Tax=Fusibacter sp. 3D3 TaxID=1048380 RepID=UPI000852FD8D|nr:hypothetical protein [Fusibacter sp. 3D3]GAU77123.1 hypothetical protein F3D3_1722 [Fusibacter sp. 3D3]